MRRFFLRQLLDLLGGLLVTVAIFLCAEAVLRLGGFGAGFVAAPRHLTAGFDEEARAFTPDPDLVGAWRVLYRPENGPGLLIPRKGSAIRVVLFGGSNTAGFPEHLLEAELEATSGRDFEVINLGRPGYGSTRAAILFRESLELLDPDAVVVYSGHNEFVEKSFAMDVQAAWGNPIVAGLARGLEQTVTGRMLMGALESNDGSEGKYASLADWEAEYRKFDGATWADTLAVWSAYEENLSYMCALAQAEGVPMLLATPVWNRFSMPRRGLTGGEPGSEGLQEATKLARRARRSYPRQLRGLLPKTEQERVHHFDWRKNKKLGEGRTQEPLPGRRPSSGWLAGRDSDHLTSCDWAPHVRELYQHLAWLHAGATAQERKRLDDALGLMTRAEALIPDDALVRYELALLHYALGERGPEARARFEAAARVDHAPRKANPHSNDRVRRVAAEFEGVRLHDTDQRFVAAVPDGLVGWEWMIDHCHLTMKGRTAVVVDWAAPLLELLEARR